MLPFLTGAVTKVGDVAEDSACLVVYVDALQRIAGTIVLGFFCTIGLFASTARVRVIGTVEGASDSHELRSFAELAVQTRTTRKTVGTGNKKRTQTYTEYDVSGFPDGQTLTCGWRPDPAKPFPVDKGTGRVSCPVPLWNTCTMTVRYRHRPGVGNATHTVTERTAKGCTASALGERVFYYSKGRDDLAPHNLEAGLRLVCHALGGVCLYVLLWNLFRMAMADSVCNYTFPTAIERACDKYVDAWYTAFRRDKMEDSFDMAADVARTAQTYVPRGMLGYVLGGAARTAETGARVGQRLSTLGKWKADAEATYELWKCATQQTGYGAFLMQRTLRYVLGFAVAGLVADAALDRYVFPEAKEKGWHRLVTFLLAVLVAHQFGKLALYVQLGTWRTAISDKYSPDQPLSFFDLPRMVL